MKWCCKYHNLYILRASICIHQIQKRSRRQCRLRKRKRIKYSTFTSRLAAYRCSSTTKIFFWKFQKVAMMALSGITGEIPKMNQAERWASFWKRAWCVEMEIATLSIQSSATSLSKRTVTTECPNKYLHRTKYSLRSHFSGELGVKCNNEMDNYSNHTACTSCLYAGMAWYAGRQKEFASGF